MNAPDTPMLMALRIVPCALGGWRSVSWISSSTCNAQQKSVDAMSSKLPEGAHTSYPQELPQSFKRFYGCFGNAIARVCKKTKLPCPPVRRARCASRDSLWSATDGGHLVFLLSLPLTWAKP